VTEASRSGGSVVLLGGLVLAAAFVFAVLPGWMSPPVVSHQPSPAASPVSPAPGPGATGAAVPGSPAPEDPGSPVPEAPIRAEAVAPHTEAPRPARRAEPPPAEPQAAAAPKDPASDEFSAQVSAGFLALDRGEFGEARDAFVRADGLRAGSPSVADGMARATAGLKEQGLATHRRNAEAAAAREDWKTAMQESEAALKLEPAVSFAVEGRARARDRHSLDERLQGYIDRPDRLSAEAVAREAEGVLARAAQTEPAGPRLQAQRAAVARLLEGSRQPLTVTFVSDGLTRVTVLRVGEMGQFKEKTLELRPGTYVAVGSRPGYRDARVTLVVPFGKSPAPVDVRCREAI